VVKQIFQTLRELARNGMTIFLVEQNAHHALKLSDRGMSWFQMVSGAECWEIRRSRACRHWLRRPVVNVMRGRVLQDDRCRRAMRSISGGVR
jgi:branched-chain amino acid transport system ATP-binding protein